MQITPPLRRHVLEPLWAIYSGASVLKVERELDRSQFWSAAQLRHRQWLSLQQLLAHVFSHNRFYRERFQQSGIALSDIRSLEDLRRLPVLRKADIRFHERDMLSDGVTTAGMVHAKTGGSTGKPIELFLPEAVSDLRAAAGRRHRRWSGWRVGEPSANVWGNVTVPRTLKGRVRDWILIPAISLDTMSITPEAVRLFAQEWARVRPTLIFGHAHSVFILATMVEALELRDVRPKAIITSSMMLLPHERVVIERIFGVKVTDLYGCEEVGLIASECERHEGLHLNAEQVIVEIVKDDGTIAGPGETGSVVVTDLLNSAMPFIRYHMEDQAEVAVAPCSCGRGLPMLRRVVGRTADFLKRADGSRVAGISLIENSLTRIPFIEQMQIVQHELLRIELRIVPGPQFTAQQEHELQAYFQAVFPTATITVSAVQAILQLPNGKYQFSICRVPD